MLLFCFVVSLVLIISFLTSTTSGFNQSQKIQDIKNENLWKILCFTVPYNSSDI